MRVALASLSATSLIDYPYTRDSLTLISGKQIADPATQAPAPGDCDPYQCGVPAPDAVLEWCSFWGQSGSRDGCADPSCAPYREMIEQCTLPQIPTMAARAMTNAIPTLTPDNIVAPLPDITRVLQPQPVYPDCSTWDKLNGAIAANPLVALAVLAGFAIAVFSSRKKRT